MLKLFKKKGKKKLSWKDVTISIYEQVLDIYQRYSRAEDDTMLPYELVCAVYGKPWEWMEKMNIREANEYVKTIEFLGTKPKPKTAKDHYIINGHKYKTTFNLQNINTAQYIDFQQMADKSEEMPAEFLAIILIPEGHKYNDGYDINDVVLDIKYFLPIEDALGLSAFFLRLFQISIRRSINALRKLKKKAEREGKMNKEQLKALQRVIEIVSENGLREWPL